MLFNSIEFIFVFLPIVIGGYFCLRRLALGKNPTCIWLVLSSLFFYGYWKPIYLILLIFSIGCNYYFGYMLTNLSHIEQHRYRALWYLVIGITVNIFLLAYFKYTYFIISNVSSIFRLTISLPKIILPLGISFFTFQQIAYLVDSYEGKTHEYNFFHYSLFVTFFPQLIAGPIVHHREMISQFEKDSNQITNIQNIAEGITFFTLGLFKKILIADALASYVSPNFLLLAEGIQFGFLHSWCVILAFSFQIYFDFSGYSDMALGLGKIFGIRLPENFNSPYKARSISEFWRKWHITLSRFLRDYLYIPMGGNRKGPKRRYINLLVTMLIGGLWHGPGWLFIIWGGLHGIYLCIHHGWKKILRISGNPSFVSTSLWAVVSRGLTFIAVVFAWVFFRSETTLGAWHLLKGMLGGFGFGEYPESMEGLLQLLGISALIVWGLPNTADFIFSRCSQWEKNSAVCRFIRWQPNLLWSLAMFIVMLVSIGNMNRVSEFIYYQF